jgi:hypothetical protein
MLRSYAFAILIISLIEMPVGVLTLTLLKVDTILPQVYMNWVPYVIISGALFIVAKMGIRLIKKRDTEAVERLSASASTDFLKLGVIICFSTTFIPVAWTAFHNIYIFTIEDAFIPLLLLTLGIPAFIVAAISAWKKTSTLYLFLYF